MSLKAIFSLLVLITGLAALALIVTTAEGQEPPPGTTTVTVPDKSEETRLVRERNSWKRTALKRGRTIKRQTAMIRRQRSATRQMIRSGAYGHPLESSFLCIKSHEGRWSDPNAPYWGGLQMDMSFQRAYGRDYLSYFGTADRWPASVQIAVAIKAYMSRGFNPWPNTARMCGLR